MTLPITPRRLTPLLMWVMACLLASCGGGGSSSAPTAPSVSGPSVSGANVQALRVGSGPAGLSIRVVNMLYTSVRLCVPGTQTCQTIDHILVDTGSTGLRLLNSVVTLPLPTVQEGGKDLYNCVQFLDQRYMWGPVVSADLHMGGPQLDGEKAPNLRIQLTGSGSAPTAPSVCAGTGSSLADSVNTLGANGILGVGPSPQDCGVGCETNAANGYYHVDLGGGAVTGTTLNRSAQLQQPVSQFAVNRNGTVISLPNLATTGAASVTGVMVFGIGTQANNTPGTTVHVLAPKANGYFSTAFQGRTLSKGFIDSGSNGWFFGADDSLSPPTCANATPWYCPTTSQTLQTVNRGLSDAPSTVNFSIGNAEQLFFNPDIYAFSNLGGDVGDDTVFGFGLPFFYGRQVYTAIDGQSTPLGTGPYVAY